MGAIPDAPAGAVVVAMAEAAVEGAMVGVVDAAAAMAGDVVAESEDLRDIRNRVFVMSQ